LFVFFVFPANKHFQQKSERLARPECLSAGQIKSRYQTKSLTKVFLSTQSTVMSNVFLCANVSYFERKTKQWRKEGKREGLTEITG